MHESFIKKHFNCDYKHVKMQAACNEWLIVNLIYKLNTRHLVYLFVERGGDDDDSNGQLIPDSQAKVRIK